MVVLRYNRKERMLKHGRPPARSMRFPQKRGRRRDEAGCGSLPEKTEKRGRRAGKQCICRGIKRNQIIKNGACLPERKKRWQARFFC